MRRLRENAQVERLPAQPRDVLPVARQRLAGFLSSRGVPDTNLPSVGSGRQRGKERISVGRSAREGRSTRERNGWDGWGEEEKEQWMGDR